MRNIEASRTIQIPEKVDLTLEGRKVTVKGEKGVLTRDFRQSPISIEKDGNSIRIWASWPRKKESSLVGTIHSHIQNMITGVTRGFTFKVKIVFSHFPITVKVKDKTVLVENFTGERSARRARIMGEAKVKIMPEDVIIQGIDLEAVSQTAANIEQSTRIKRKDPRIFLDGLFVYERTEGMES